MKGLDWAVAGLIALAVLLFAGAVVLFIAAVWATGETGDDLFLTGMILAGTSLLIAFALAGLA